MISTDVASLWFIPTNATDAFPTAAHGSTTSLAASVFSGNVGGAKLDGWQILNFSAGSATIAFKDTAGNSLFTVTTIGTSGASQIRTYGPNGLDMGSGFSVNVGVDASAAILFWYRLPPQG